MSTDLGLSLSHLWNCIKLCPTAHIFSYCTVSVSILIQRNRYEYFNHFTLISFFVGISLNVPFKPNVIYFSRLLNCFNSLDEKQCGPDQSVPIGVFLSCSTLFVSPYDRQLFAADD